MAFSVPAAGNFDLYFLEDTGGAPRRLTSDPGADFAPARSPEGDALYFGSTRSGAWQIRRHDLRDGSERPLTERGGRVAQVSPDGRYLYYVKAII